MYDPLTKSDPFRKIVTGIILFFAVSILAIIGYMSQGWNFDDAVYMVIITIFGVGYGEVQPVESVGLRALTMTVIVTGYGAVIYTVGGLVQMLVDGELNKALGARRMNLEIDKLSGHTIICGFGRMGTMLTRELKTSGKQFLVIDNDEGRLKQAIDSGYLVLLGDATEERILERARISQAEVLATVLSDDALNVFVTITARTLNPHITIIARGENPSTEKKLLGSGADQVVLPTAIGASRIAHLIKRPTAVNILGEICRQQGVNQEVAQIGLEFDELQVTDHSPLKGQRLSEIEVKGNYGFLIVGIRSGHGNAILNPPAETILNEGDIVVILGHRDDIPQVAQRFAKSTQTLNYRGVKF